MNDAPTMPFGKHKGRPLAGIPKPYLEWAIEKCTLRPLLRAQVQAVLDEKPIPTEPQKCRPGGDDWYLSEGVLEQIEAMFATKRQA
jgi:hypothetical protein